MTVSAEAFIDRYGQYVDARTAVILAGAGVSADADFPYWKTLIEPFAPAVGSVLASKMPESHTAPEVAHIFEPLSR